MWRGGKVHGRVEDEPGGFSSSNTFFHLRTPGGRYLHNDPEEVLGRPDDSKTKELPFHLMVQPALHGRLVYRDWERGNSGAFVNFPILPPLVFSLDFS